MTKTYSTNNFTSQALEDFDREFVKRSRKNVEPVFKDPVGSVGPIKSFLKSKLEEAVRGAIEDCIKLSDEIELSQPDGGTEQWKAFKHFRNTMRDKLKETK